jgi:hypothetical protein
MIVVHCPACKSPSQVPEAVRGKAVRCPKCQQAFRVPDAVPPAVPVAAAPVAVTAAPPPPAPAPVAKAAAAQRVQARPGKLPAATPPGPRRDWGDAKPPRASRSPVVLLIVLCVAIPLVLLLVGLGVVVLGGALFLMPVSNTSTQSGPAPVARAADNEPPVRVPDNIPNKKAVNPNEADKKVEKKDDVKQVKEKKIEEKKVKEKVDKKVEEKKFPENNTEPPEQPQPVTARQLVIPPPAPVTLAPAKLEGPRVPLQLPGAAYDMAVAGGGRYLVFYLKDQKDLQKLAVFDTAKAEIVKELVIDPDEDERVLLAASVDKLMVVYGEAKAIERYSLPDLRNELGGKGKLPMKVPVIAAAMGCLSNGPLVVTGVETPEPPETLFVDVLGLKRLNPPLDANFIFDTTPTAFLRVSADGSLFACQPRTQIGDSLQLLALERGQIKRYVGNGRLPVPAADGRTVFTDHGILTPKLKIIKQDGYHHIPAVRGPFYLKFSNDGMSREREVVPLHVLGTEKPVAQVELDNLEKPKPPIRPTLPFDKRVIFIPDAKLLVTIPSNGEQLVLRRFDPEAELKKSKLPYMYVASQPVRTATRGAAYRYVLDARTHNGDVDFARTEGPPGMKVSPAGELTWQVPPDFPAEEVDVVVTVHSGTQRVDHSFRIYLGPRGK